MYARATFTVPSLAEMPRSRFVTEAQLAALLQVTRETLRSWRRRGEMPPVATDPEAEAFAASQRTRGKLPTVYRVADISAWLFGDDGPDGRPAPMPASAFDPANDRTDQLRRAAEATPDPKEKKRLLRQLTGQAKLVARLGFSSPTADEDWLARGAPEGELPAEVRAAREAVLHEACDPDAPLADEQDSERLQLRSDAAIAKMRGVAPNVVTAERRHAEPPRPRGSAVTRPAERERPTSQHQPSADPTTAPERQAMAPHRPPQTPREAPLSPWATLDDDPLFDPFAAAGRSAVRRQGSGYWGH